MSRFSVATTLALWLLPRVAGITDELRLPFDEGAGLDADNECREGAGFSGAACSLSALQRRGRSATRGPVDLRADAGRSRPEARSTGASLIAEEAGWGSCGILGCLGYRRGLPCQCNAECNHYRNCCFDYSTVCLPASPQPSLEPSTPAPTVVPVPGRTPASKGQVFGHPSSSIAYPSYPGFTLLLAEEFDGPVDLDSDPIWTWSDGGLFEGQVRFVKDAITFSEGTMKITAQPGDSRSQTCSAAEKGLVKTKRLTSGEIRTRHNLFRYGRYEARMKAPEVQPGNPHVNGNFIATLFVYKDAKFNHWREIDMEVTGDAPNSVTTNMLSADHTSRWSTHIARSRAIHPPGNLRAEFHTYAFEWLPASITWYVDGAMVRRTTGQGLPIPDRAAKIMMNLWIFDTGYHFGGGQGYNNRYPMTSEYEYFRFYKWDGETQYPCAGLGTSCLTPDDLYLSKNNPCDGIEQVGTVNGAAPCDTRCQ
mmetsp:Transcript_5965/g.14164  ORF Transcript_5965/g.14164 Transcript_5965/m.14164 type:complete len:479 (+) Transcript_5965:71-1507(+)